MQVEFGVPAFVLGFRCRQNLRMIVTSLRRRFEGCPRLESALDRVVVTSFLDFGGEVAMMVEMVVKQSSMSRESLSRRCEWTEGGIVISP